jgi:hypothetical protein
VVSDSDASYCIGCGKKLDEEDRQNFTTTEKTSVVPRDNKYVYPHLPPLSPHLCWTNICYPGLAQLIYGQKLKGIIVCLAAVVLGIATGGILYIPILVAAVIDAYRVGRALKAGEPVRKMQFFLKLKIPNRR